MNFPMTYESILARLPKDETRAIDTLIKHYHDNLAWAVYYRHNETMQAAFNATLTQVARELARRLLAAYPVKSGDVDMDEVMSLERIAGG